MEHLKSYLKCLKPTVVVLNLLVLARWYRAMKSNWLERNCFHSYLPCYQEKVKRCIPLLWYCEGICCWPSSANYVAKYCYGLWASVKECPSECFFWPAFYLGVLFLLLLMHLQSRAEWSNIKCHVHNAQQCADTFCERFDGSGVCSIHWDMLTIPLFAYWSFTSTSKWIYVSDRSKNIDHYLLLQSVVK